MDYTGGRKYGMGDAMDLAKDREFLQRLARGIAAQFGECCEVTLHDVTGDADSTIIAIENGHVTGRKVGDGASEAVLKARVSGQVHDHYNYHTRTADGRILKSSSIYIRDEDGRVIGLIGINYDTTDLVMAQSALEKLTATDAGNGKAVDIIPQNVNDLLDSMIEESRQRIGKPVALMTKEDKVRAIQHLNARGALLIKKSGDRIAKFYDISKYTLYSYLDADID